MTTLEFLRRVLPSEGVYFLVKVDSWNDKVTGQPRTAFKHFPFEHLETMAAACDQFVGEKTDIYFACSAYAAAEVVDSDGKTRYRTHANVRAMRAFWQDVDCGPDKPYPDQPTAARAIMEFVKQTGLPVPMSLSSGRGIHIYWPLTEELHPNRWRDIARKLKLLLDKGQPPLAVDSSRSRDPSSILRPAGTANFKNPAEPKPVRVISPGGDVDPTDFEKRIDQALRNFGVDAVADEREVRKVASKFDAVPHYEERRYSGVDIAQRCAQVALMRDKKGNIPEPQWFHTLEVLKFCEDGEKLAHTWGSGHPAYSFAETELKRAQIAKSGVGPTTCAKFEAVNPDGCKGCPHFKKITSPVVLGQMIEIAEPAVVEREDGTFTVPNAPWPFIRGTGKEAGIWVETDEGERKRIYNYDLYPYDIVFDRGQGKELVTFRHTQPIVGEVDVRIATEDLFSPADLFKAFANSHVHISVGKYQLLMVRYVNDYIQQLRDSTRIRQLYQTLGWKEDGFLLGNTLYTEKGPVTVSVASKLTKIVEGLTQAGSREEWIKATELLNRPGWEQYAWPVTAAFGAPLLKLAGYGGAIINLFSTESGAGKTTAARWGASIYGDWDAMRSSQDSTFNAKIEKLGLFANLPFYMDEMTTIKPEDVEKLSYAVSDGKGKDRLNRASQLQDASEWSTFVIATSNARMHSKLQGLKGDSEANCARIFEAEFTEVPDFRELAPQINQFLDGTYGVVGAEYIAEIVRRGPEQIREKIQKTIKALDAHWGINNDGKQRFWIATIAAAAVGAGIAREIGISRIDVAKTMGWANRMRLEMLGGIAETKYTTDNLLEEFMSYHGNSIVVARELHAGERQRSSEKYMIESMPIGEVRSDEFLVRVEPDHHRVWVNASAFNAWLRKRADYKTSIHRLLTAGNLIDTKGKQFLAGWKGIDQTSGIGHLRCHEFWTGDPADKPWSKLQAEHGVPEPKPKYRTRLPDNLEKLKALSQQAA